MAIKRKRKKLGDYTQHNTVQVIRGGSNYFKQIESIADNARYTLHLQTYIYENDKTGIKVAESLINAANRGVQVYVLLDGYASQSMRGDFIKKFKDAGVHIGFFEPLLRSRHFYFGRRMHHKVVVADASVCLIGGLNISDRYNDLPDAPAWLDWALLVQGEVAQNVDEVCIRMWNRSPMRRKYQQIDRINLSKQDGNTLVRLRRNDWVYRQTQITSTYHEAFVKAKSEIIVMTSYFWPALSLLRKMKAASKRGVEVTLVLTGSADVPFVKYAERFLYNFLLRHKIKVYEYMPNVLHGKIAVKDKEWITVGSYNVNNISALASIEMNLDVLDNDVAEQLHNAVHEIIRKDCKQITKESFASSNSPLHLFLYYLSYKLIHILFFLFTFYFTRQKRGS